MCVYIYINNLTHTYKIYSFIKYLILFQTYPKQYQICHTEIFLKTFFNSLVARTQCYIRFWARYNKLIDQIFEYNTFKCNTCGTFFFLLSKRKYYSRFCIRWHECLKNWNIQYKLLNNDILIKLFMHNFVSIKSYNIYYTINERRFDVKSIILIRTSRKFT